MHIGPVYRHAGTGVGLVVQLYASFPVAPAVGGAEVEDACSVPVGIGLAAENMDRIAARNDDGAANFLTGLCNSNRAAPCCAVVGGFAKIQRLANSAHVASRGEEIDRITNSIKAAVLHWVIR